MIDYYKKYLKYKNKYLTLSKSLIGGDPTIKYLLATVLGLKFQSQYNVVYQIKNNTEYDAICYAKLITDPLNEYIPQSQEALGGRATLIDPIQSISVGAIVRIQNMGTRQLNGAIGIITSDKWVKERPVMRAKIFILEPVNAVDFVQNNPASRGNRHVLIKKTNLVLAQEKAQRINDLVQP